MGSNTVRECGKGPKEIPMWANGDLGRLMGSESIRGSTEIATRASFINAKSTDKALRSSSMETYTKEGILKESLKDLANTTGLMGAIIKGISI